MKMVNINNNKQKQYSSQFFYTKIHKSLCLKDNVLHNFMFIIEWEKLESHVHGNLPLCARS